MTALDPAPCPPKTRRDLEWDRLLSALADRCAGVPGKKLALALPFAATREEAARRLGEASEAAALRRRGEPLPTAALPELGVSLDRARAEGVLSPVELRALAAALESARTTRRFLASRRATCPLLHAALTTDPTLDALEGELSGSFDPDGTLADRASPRLRELRSERDATRARMLSRLEELMRRYEGILQDSFVTEREGRWVLPVRKDAHERFPGLVHATSGSGATLFVEPRAVIPLGNRLKVLDADVEREELAVYARLSGLVRDMLPSATAAVEALATADVLAAIAALAEDASLTFPELCAGPELSLVRARHPLLALDGVAVVPSDARLEGGHAMIISGPNAGGKTVVLKTLGLAALMVRAGLPVPAAEGSRVGLFDRVLTDVGDDQSLHKNLSTFSAHVKNLAQVLEDTHRGVLVLLDELATGTDPREGEALAAGLLDSLTARGGTVGATTHYEGLKALALADPRFVNASVGFDYATMTPTFELAMGVPGRSSALAVAARFGLPRTVLERAERFLSREDLAFESTVKKLDDERAALALARAEATRKAEDLARQQEEVAAELARLRARGTKELALEAESLRRGLERAREGLRAAQATLRGKRAEPAELAEAQRALTRAFAEVSLGGALEPLLASRGDDPIARSPLAPAHVRRGARAWVARLRAEAEILEVASDGMVRVAAGALRVKVPVAELFAAETASERPRARRPSALQGEATDRPREAIQTGDNTCDLRGLRVDDAVAMARAFLDRALNAGARVCFLVHGHGTGAVRDAVRRELSESAYVEHFRPGGAHEGGDGATVVHLA